MASNKIKGLTVEIGGDTTKLGKALDDVDKRTRSLSSELGEINKLLKLDPGNTELLAQKQKVLAEAISNTGKKLATLKEAEKQVQAQFERGEVSEEQVRALQREIIATEKKLNGYEQAAKETAEQIENVGKKSKEAGDKTSDFGEKVKAVGEVAAKGFAVVGAAAGAVVAGMTAAAEGSREYRTEMGKLDTAFTQNGHTSEAAVGTYKELQGVLGETDQAVEAANHLAKLTDNEADLAKWSGDILPGVFATFGASLPIEGLTEAANETAKTGALTGSLADALNWAGVSEDDFQAKLDKCNTEQERQALITETLTGLYGEASAAYKEANAEVIRANQANEAWASSMAEVGGAVDPIITDVKMLGASMLSDLVPGVTQAAGSFRDLLNGDTSAASGIGEALSGIVTQLLGKVTELAPTMMQVAVSLVTTLTTSLISMVPQLVTTGLQLFMSLLTGLTQAIPQITAALVGMIPQLVAALVTGIPQLIQGAVQFLLAIVQAIPQILPPLIAALPQICLAIINGLLTAIPQLIQGAVQFLLAIVQAIPQLIDALIPQIPVIVTTVINGLLDNIPLLVDAAFKLLFGIVTAIPDICKALIRALPQIWTTMSNYFKTLPSKIKEIGKSLVRGLWNGIKDMTGWVKDKIKGFSKDVLNGIKSFFGIKSPSRVMRDQVGKMIAKGLAAGIDAGAPEVVKAMENLENDVIKQAESIMSSFGLFDFASILKEESDVDGSTLLNNLSSQVTALQTWTDELEKLRGKIGDTDLFDALAGLGVKNLHEVQAINAMTAGQLEQYVMMYDQKQRMAAALAHSQSSGLVVEEAGKAAEKAGQSGTSSASGKSSNAALLEKLNGIYDRLGRLKMVTDTGAFVGEIIDDIDAHLSERQRLVARGVY